MDQELSNWAAEQNRVDRAKDLRRRQIGSGVLGVTALVAAGVAAKTIDWDKLYLGPDAREVAMDEADIFNAAVQRDCGIQPKAPLTERAIQADSTMFSAAVRYTLDAYSPEQEACVKQVLELMPTVSSEACDVAISHPRGWTEADGGMRMSVLADCTPLPE